MIIYIYIYVCVCVCVYIYRYTHMHIYIHTHNDSYLFCSSKIHNRWWLLWRLNLLPTEEFYCLSQVGTKFRYFLQIVLLEINRKLYFWSILYLKYVNIVSKFGYCCQGQPKGPLFISHYIEVYWGATPFPGLLHFTLDPYLMQKHQIPFLECLLWLDLRLNPDPPGQWRMIQFENMSEDSYKSPGVLNVWLLIYKFLNFI